MQLIRAHLHHWDSTLRRVPLAADRLTLVKRRWRAVASDGVEFGFDLEHSLADGDVFHQTEAVVYHLSQKPEPLLEIPFGTAEEAATLGWKIGNLHFSIEVTPTATRVVDDAAIRQMLVREGIKFARVVEVFRPLNAGHPHGLGHVAH